MPRRYCGPPPSPPHPSENDRFRRRRAYARRANLINGRLSAGSRRARTRARCPHARSGPGPREHGMR